MSTYTTTGRFARAVYAGAAIFMLGLPTHPALANDDDDITKQIESKAEEAAQHFAAKDFAKAVRAYVEAYQIAQRPSDILYNIAFIYDAKLKEYDMAAIYYKKYAAAADADPGLVEKAIRRMGELREMANKRPEPKQPDGKKPTALDNTPATRPGSEVASGAGDRQRTGGIAALVTGGVVMLAAGGLYVAALLGNDDFKTAGANERVDLAESGQTYALAGDVLMGVGGAAALVGLILMATAPAAPQRSGELSVGASVLPGGAAVGVGGTF